jgi:hypothetical protein
MTLRELELGFELHEKRMQRIDERLDRAAAAADRAAAMAEGHENRLKRVEDNLAVQGELLDRIDLRLDRLTETFAQSEGERAADRERTRLMQAAMTSLFNRMDAFIRGLERHDGHGETSFS